MDLSAALDQHGQLTDELGARQRDLAQTSGAELEAKTNAYVAYARAGMAVTDREQHARAAAAPWQKERYVLEAEIAALTAQLEHLRLVISFAPALALEPARA